MKKYNLLFVVCLLFLNSCTPKSQAAYTPELVKAFNEAGLSLLSQKITPRDFTLPLLSSESVPEALRKVQSLSALKGKVVFLNFWATWCGPCRVEMPSMETLYLKYKDKGFEILAVNSGERNSEVMSFMTSYGLSFPTVLDTDGTVSRFYGIQAIPTSYLIDREGNMILRLVGSIDWDTPQIHAALELLLEQ
ncbi:MAG: TlpA family protein disulfide reductase [Treponema sp.]|jgi:thiol-disulfide isomerase/thioredoxin|nr:TlpA family protein disulfide reductase [Treponema sp.]